MNIVKWYTKAVKRENRVRELEWKPTELLTREEAIEVLKWKNERDRNNAIAMVGISLVAHICAKKAFKKANQG